MGTEPTRAEAQKVALHTRVEHDLTLHAPTPEAGLRMDVLRTQAKQLAHQAVEICPSSRELSNGLSRLEEALFHFVAALARNPERVPLVAPDGLAVAPDVVGMVESPGPPPVDASDVHVATGSAPGFVAGGIIPGVPPGLAGRPDSLARVSDVSPGS